MSAEMNEYDHHGWAEAVRLTRKVVGRRVEGAKVIGFLEALVAVVVGLKPALLFEAAALEAEELHALALEIVGVLFPRTHNTNITASALACLVLEPATDPTAGVDDDAAFWGPGTLFLADLSHLVPRLEKQLHHRDAAPPDAAPRAACREVQRCVQVSSWDVDAGALVEEKLDDLDVPLPCSF